jgi:hypothetical protein
VAATSQNTVPQSTGRIRVDPLRVVSGVRDEFETAFIDVKVPLVDMIFDFREHYSLQELDDVASPQ